MVGRNVSRSLTGNPPLMARTCFAARHLLCAQRFEHRYLSVREHISVLTRIRVQARRLAWAPLPLLLVAGCWLGVGGAVLLWSAGCPLRLCFFILFIWRLFQFLGLDNCYGAMFILGMWAQLGPKHVQAKQQKEHQ